MRVILTGGCTGGHIYPAIAIGNKIREKRPNAEIIYVAHQWGLETTIVPKAGYDLKIVTAEWFDRKNPVRIAKTLMCTLKGRKEAYKIMKEFKPNVVISTGSFVSVPVVLAAHKYGARIYIQEQNAFPGLSNKILSKYARKIFLGFEKGRDQFDNPDKCIYSGNPVRADFYGRDKKQDREALGVASEDFVIMAFGGSLGSSTINDIEIELIKEYGGKEGVTLILGAGRDYYDSVMETLEKEGLSDFSNVRISPYIDGVPETLSVSDVVIARSGALSVAEITMSGRAAIFVPSPNVTADHQYFNAKAVADKGGAIIVRENDDTTKSVLSAVDELKEEPSKCAKMGEASLSIAPTRAADIIYEEIMEDYVRQ